MMKTMPLYRHGQNAGWRGIVHPSVQQGDHDKGLTHGLKQVGAP